MEAFRAAIRAMRGYTPGEQPQDRRYVKLNTNENPYPPSPSVAQALTRVVGSELRLYPDPTAGALRAAASALYGIPREQILVGNGSDDLLTMLVRACIGPGDRIAYPVPTYSLYDTLAEIQQGEVVRVPFAADFRLPSALADANAKLTIICNPNSPSGTLTPVGELARFAAKTSGLVVVDEAYVDFADETALALVGRTENVIVLRTLSKSYSLAGVRIGLAFGAASVLGELMKVKDSYNVNRLSIVAAVAALGDQDWMRDNVARIRATRGRLTASLRDLGYEVPDSQTNFVLARKPGVDQEGIYLGCKERGVLVRYFAVDGLRDALRITVGTEEEIDALLAALRSHQGRDRRDG
jgi:histidinol-phosphate aminotransferase